MRSLWAQLLFGTLLLGIVALAIFRRRAATAGGPGGAHGDRVETDTVALSSAFTDAREQLLERREDGSGGYELKRLMPERRFGEEEAPA